MLAHLGSADLQTLDALITAGIGESRSAVMRWALARVREQPVYTQLSAADTASTMDRATRDRLQAELEEQVRQRFPAREVQRVALLRAWERQHEAISRDLHRELAGMVPDHRGHRH